MMRSPEQFWANTCDDPRWIDHQAAVLEEAMREAFAAGYAEGVELAVRGIDGHAKGLGSNLAVRLPESVPRALRAFAQRMSEFGVDRSLIENAWKRCTRAAGPASCGAAAKEAG